MEKMSIMKLLIKANDMTINDVAEYMGVTRAIISTVINGRGELSEENGNKFLEKMKITHEQYKELKEYEKELRQINMCYEEKFQLLMTQAHFFIQSNKIIEKHGKKSDFFNQNKKLTIINTIIKAQDLTIEETSKIFGLSPEYIYALERGNIEISNKLLIRFLQEFGIFYKQYEYLRKYTETLNNTGMEYPKKYHLLLRQILLYIHSNLRIKEYIKELETNDLGTLS